ncbi:hypothetical protein H9L12_08390 [Sphingomonas rhizophila]|uniref:Uncharacterized protein n=1 Tax=Sphingomonas rhizophila TaxID=2071607 RepID=A0A7G9S925_9SPHN|nr:hypothetical protein [Sphingomonas rhizophila]QNN64350.1 hypothetical protein H9L12_08390 [Sphingomonas rhizophila]
MATPNLSNEPKAANYQSLIEAMHERYERAWEEYNRVDEASTALSDKNESERLLQFRYRDAMLQNSGETDALRLAILHQVPTTWVDALILQFHINCITDPNSEMTAEEVKAVSIASDTLFDFMCDEVDHNENVGIFHRSECIVSERRRLRTGHVAKAA